MAFTVRTKKKKTGVYLVYPVGSLDTNSYSQLDDEIERLLSKNPAVIVFDLEELELELIDSGLEEIDESDDMIVAYADYTNFGNLSKGLEDQGVEVKKATLQRIPTSPVMFSEEQLEEIDKMLDKIEDDEDVQAVYTNIGN